MKKTRAGVDVFRVIADPTRRAILDRLRAGAAPVNALAADFELSRPTVSKHLRVLKRGQLVIEEKADASACVRYAPRHCKRRRPGSRAIARSGCGASIV